jgi:multidrug efflux pump subunit AcrA (membrane-fusion protein)
MIAFTLTTIAAAGLVGCRGPGPARTDERIATAVRVETVSRTTVTRTIQLLGTLQGESQVMVTSRVTGRVTEITKPEGSAVSTGEAIAWVVNDVPGMDYQPGPVLSPISGTVGRVYVEVGQTVSPATPFAAVASFSGRLRARASVSDADLPFVRRGAPATLSLSALTDTSFSGTVTRVSPMLDPMSRAATVELSVPNPGRRLVPGMAASVRLEAERRDGVTAVPLAALVSDGGDRVVVVEGTTARFRTVRAGLRGDDMVEVIEGLAPGDKVATVGKERVRDGETVNPVEANNP